MSIRSMIRNALRRVLPQSPKSKAKDITRDFMEGRMSHDEARAALLAAGGANLLPAGMRQRIERQVDKRMSRLVELRKLYLRAEEMKRTGEDKTKPAEYAALWTKAQRYL